MNIKNVKTQSVFTKTKKESLLIAYCKLLREKEGILRELIGRYRHEWQDWNFFMCVHKTLPQPTNQREQYESK
jgi:hypothetical protein